MTSDAVYHHHRYHASVAVRQSTVLQLRTVQKTRPVLLLSSGSERRGCTEAALLIRFGHRNGKPCIPRRFAGVHLPGYPTVVTPITDGSSRQPPMTADDRPLPMAMKDGHGTAGRLPFPPSSAGLG
jgi:hypothetical protein